MPLFYSKYVCMHVVRRVGREIGVSGTSESRSENRGLRLLSQGEGDDSACLTWSFRDPFFSGKLFYGRHPATLSKSAL
jgi:hypothetical protein